MGFSKNLFFLKKGVIIFYKKIKLNNSLKKKKQERVY
jgi:hypothetical protein